VFKPRLCQVQIYHCAAIPLLLAPYTSDGGTRPLRRRPGHRVASGSSDYHLIPCHATRQVKCFGYQASSRIGPDDDAAGWEGVRAQVEMIYHFCEASLGLAAREVYPALFSPFVFTLLLVLSSCRSAKFRSSPSYYVFFFLSLFLRF
jgi:hypothetical protein